MSRWAKTFAIPLLLLVWGVFALWQYQGFRHERALIKESLHQQSHSVMGALIGGARSHRRFGHYFQEQLRGMLHELVSAHDVLAAAVVKDSGAVSIASGETELLKLENNQQPGDYWDADGFRLVEQFHLESAMPRVSAGPGFGFGGEPGERMRMQQGEGRGPFSGGGDYTAVLLLDRARVDMLTRHAVQTHWLVAATGTLVLALVAFAWRANVRVVEADGRSRLLETEAKHLRDLSQAAAGLAHETRNPLGLIRGWTQRLAQANGADQQRTEHARAVMEECDRVTARINQFLAFAKPRATEPQLVELEQLLNELNVLLQPDLDAKQIVLVQELERNCAAIKADRELLRQSLFNLLQNAIHFSPTGGKVTIATHQTSQGACQISVIDQGPGVAPEQVDSLFTPYCTTRLDGTGLGLAIVQQIANRHDWQISYKPADGGGAVFTLENIHG